MVPRRSRSAQPFVLQVSKCLSGHKHRHTNTIGLFFIDPPEEVFDHDTFNAKALTRHWLGGGANIAPPSDLSH